MHKRVVYVHTEQETTPRFFEVIKEIKADVLGDEYELKPGTQAPQGSQVIVFGKIESTSSIFLGQELIYTYSPAQVMAKADALTVVGSAMRKATRQMPRMTEHASEDKLTRMLSGKFITHTESRRYSTIAAYYRFKEVLGRTRFEYIAVDIETGGNFVTGDDTVEDVPLINIAFYGVADDGRAYAFSFNGIGAADTASRIFEKLGEQGTKYIYHNGKFDTRVLERILKRKLRVDEDSMLLHHVLYQAASSHGLKVLAMRYLGAHDWEADIKKYLKKGEGYETIPPEILAEYNYWDVYYTYNLWLFLTQQMIDENTEKAYRMELRASEFLLRVEQRGIPIDMDALDDLENDAERRANFALEHMREIIGNDNFNPNSPKQVKETYAAAYGIDLPGTSVDVIRPLTEHYNSSVSEFSQELLDFRENNKIARTYARGWRKLTRNGRVHPTFLIHGTSTGRLSSSSPNAQNIPRSKRVRRMVGV